MTDIGNRQDNDRRCWSSAVRRKLFGGASPRTPTCRMRAHALDELPPHGGTPTRKALQTPSREYNSSVGLSILYPASCEGTP